MPNWVTDLLPLVAALAAVWLTQSYQGRRDKKNDERSLRDRKAARLRESYQSLLLITTQRESLAMGWRWFPGEVLRDEKKLQSRVQQLLEESRIDVDASQVSLLLESEKHGRQVLEIFESFNRALMETFSHVMQNIQDKDPQPLGPVLARLAEARATLAETARTHLAELEKPL